MSPTTPIDFQSNKKHRQKAVLLFFTDGDYDTDWPKGQMAEIHCKAQRHKAVTGSQNGEGLFHIRQDRLLGGLGGTVILGIEAAHDSQLVKALARRFFRKCRARMPQ